MKGKKNKKADEKEFVRVYKLYRNNIFVFIMARVGNKAVALDIASDVFAALWIKRDSVRNDTVKSWLYKVAHNKVIDYFRKQSIRKEVPLDREMSSDNNTMWDVVIQSIKEEKLKKMLKSLTKLEMDVVALKVYDELTFNEAAEVLGKGVGTVKATYYRAIDKLKEMASKGGK